MSWDNQTFTMVVGNIKRENDRVYLIKKGKPGSVAVRYLGEFYVGVSEDVAADIKIGDVIEYESAGVNSGWFVRKL